MSHKGFSYRIYPTAEQKVLINKAFGTARFVYNWALDLRQTTYKETGTGKYFAAVLCDAPEPTKLPERNTAVGVDLGLHTFATLSTGEKINLPKSLYKADKKIRKANRELHHRVKGSRNRAKARIKLAKAYEKLTNRREDFQHKVSLKLVRENQAIGLETLAVLNLMRRRKTGKISKKTGKEITHRGLGRAFALAAFGKFLYKVGYKADWYGRFIVYSDRFYPSIQLCHCCEYKNPKVKDLKVREWTCPKCHAHHDRDINAALNLLNEVLKVFPELANNQSTNRDGIARINACGDLTSIHHLISDEQATSLKQETTDLGQ
jgi:putative transposase